MPALTRPSCPGLPLISSICLLILISCSSRKEGEGITRTHSFQMVEEDGIPVALSSGGPKFVGELFNYEYLLSLQEDEREESLLYQPYMFTMDETEHYYVSDFGDSRVAVFDSEGRYSHSIGRRGEGPGEFGQPMIQEIRDGIISIFDLVQQRVSRFRTDGTFLDVTSTPLMAGFSESGLRLVEDGRRVMITQEYDLQGEDMEFEEARALVLSAEEDTLWASNFEKVKSDYVAKVVFIGRELEMPIPYPYGGRAICLYEPDLGILFSNSWNPIVDVYDLEGKHTIRIRIDEDPVPTTREDMVPIQELWDWQMEEAKNEANRKYAQSMRESIILPEYKAFWMSVELDDAGYFWLLEESYGNASMDDENRQCYRVLSPEGEYLGKTRVPKGFSGIARCGRYLINDMDPETGFFELKVYEIRPAVSGLKYP